MTTASSSYTSLSSSTYLNATSTSKSGSVSSATSITSSASATATTTTNHTYIRIMLNDAVYPVPSCQSGPGKSCLMSEYVSFMAARLAAAGDLPTRCNVTAAGAPTKIKGASFFTDLSDSWLATVAP
jgi:hypothetical protein